MFSPNRTLGGVVFREQQREGEGGTEARSGEAGVECLQASSEIQVIVVGEAREF